jgi:copper(I)-binding protein
MTFKPALTLALAALLSLAACKGKAPTPAGSEAAPTPSISFVVVSGARLVLPAVSGNPAALYLTIANPGTDTVRLTGIAVAGAGETELHQTSGGAMAPLPSLEIAPGTAASLEPGSRHAMVIGLKPAPAPGRDIAVTLKFAGGTTFATTARVEPAGGDTAMDAMPGMSGSMSGHAMKDMH